MKRPENHSHLFTLDTQRESSWIVGAASTEVSEWSAFPAEAAAMMTKESRAARCLCLQPWALGAAEFNEGSESVITRELQIGMKQITHFLLGGEPFSISLSLWNDGENNLGANFYAFLT